MSSVEEQVLKQVEFYFSDSNLPRDKFLRSLVAHDDKGFVPIETIASFKRMKQITEDLKAVVDALRKSTMLEVDETGTKVRRSTPLPQEDTLEQRSIYAKGLPKDSTLDSLQTFFEKYGKVLSVRMRKNMATKDFKGTAFIEFETPEKAQEVAKLQVKFNESDENNLELKMKSEWEEEHRQMREQKKANKESKAHKGPSEEEIKQNLKFDAGCLLKITNIGTADESFDYNTLKNENAKHGDVAYADFPIGDDRTKAYIRFKNAESAQKAYDAFTSEKKAFGGSESTFEIATGEEEEKYYLDLAIKNVNKNNQKKKKGGFKKHDYKKGGKKGGKRKLEDSSDREAKKPRLD